MWASKSMRFRFSLRTLFVVVTIIAVVLWPGVQFWSDLVLPMRNLVSLLVSLIKGDVLLVPN